MVRRKAGQDERTSGSLGNAGFDLGLLLNATARRGVLKWEKSAKIVYNSEASTSGEPHAKSNQERQDST